MGLEESNMAAKEWCAWAVAAPMIATSSVAAMEFLAVFMDES